MVLVVVRSAGYEQGQVIRKKSTTNSTNSKMNAKTANVTNTISDDHYGNTALCCRKAFFLRHPENKELSNACNSASFGVLSFFLEFFFEVFFFF